MGLYLCVFAPGEVDDELDGVEVGSYDDFHQFRTKVADSLEDGRWGSRFPTLMNQPDSDTEWTVQQAGDLIGELQTIEQECRRLPPQAFPADSWQAGVAKSFGLAPQSLAESLIDVDGELLVPRLIGLAELAVETGSPISFQ